VKEQGKKLKISRNNKKEIVRDFVGNHRKINEVRCVIKMSGNVMCEAGRFKYLESLV